MPYITFNSPESTNAIIDYLEDRSEKHELKIDNYLFVYREKQMKERGFAGYFSRLNDTCNFGWLGRQRFFRSHGLRKFFGSTLKNNGMDKLDADWLLGHKTDAVTEAYFMPDTHRLKKDYMDVLPHLSLEKIETVTIESPDVQELKKYNVMLKESNSELDGRVNKLEKAHYNYNEIFELFDDPEVTQAIIRAKARKIQENK
jgi:hypothetical protein